MSLVVQRSGLKTTAHYGCHKSPMRQGEVMLIVVKLLFYLHFTSAKNSPNLNLCSLTKQSPQDNAIWCYPTFPSEVVASCPPTWGLYQLLHLLVRLGSHLWKTLPNVSTPSSLRKYQTLFTCVTALWANPTQVNIFTNTQ